MQVALAVPYRQWARMRDSPGNRIFRFLPGGPSEIVFAARRRSLQSPKEGEHATADPANRPLVREEEPFGVA